jgi:hypothetical protein
MTTLRMTYEELGERIGRSPEGARMLARRRRWRVEKGNDGKARVVVDEADLVVRPTGRPTGQPPGHDQEPPPPTTGEIEVLRAQVLALTERAAKAEGETTALRELVDELRRQNNWLRLPWWRRWL